MKILTIIGTRPELIRLSIIIKKLDKLVKHIIVYTNQNYDHNLSTIFFNKLNIRKPDYYFTKDFKSVGEFLGNSFIEFEQILKKEKPDKILVLGDTNSGLLSIISQKHKIPVYHMEAGNRCFDDRLPEETNRKIIDLVSKYNLPYTENSKKNLLNEGFHKNFVFKTGNPIYEVLKYYENKINNSTVLHDLTINEEYVLVTMHRSESVDDPKILLGLINALNKISKQYLVIISLHPRTKNMMDKFNYSFNDNVLVLKPLGFFDFVHLEKNAKCVISDSGTVQEECCIFGIPCLTIRESTERQETIECGSNILCGTNEHRIMESFNIIINNKNKWNIPHDYLNENVSDTIINILIGK